MNMNIFFVLVKWDLKNAASTIVCAQKVNLLQICVEMESMLIALAFDNMVNI